MLLKMIRYIKGYIRIRVAGYSAERFLNACCHRGIFLWGLRPVSGAYEMNITVKDFRQLKPIIRKTGTKVTIVKRSGLPFLLHKYRKRKLFFTGFFLCVLLVILMSRYIWNIDVTGNLSYTDETILEFLHQQNIENGMQKSDVDCTRIVKDIRKQYNDIIWVSASIKGTRLLIQIKENEDSIPVKEEVSGEPTQPVDIVADRDCVITDIVVRSGIVQVQPGTQVKKGDLLVSGQVPVNNDAKETIGYQYQVSDADITGKTHISYKDTMPRTYTEKKDIGIQKDIYSVIIGKHRMTLGVTKNPYEHFEENGTFHQLKLFENFYLPVFWSLRTVSPYEPVKQLYTDEQLQKQLSLNFSRYCEDLEKKGVEILENDVKIYRESDSARAEGTLTVLMSVGKEKAAERIEIPPEQKMEQTGEAADGNDGNSN